RQRPLSGAVQGFGAHLARLPAVCGTRMSSPIPQERVRRRETSSPARRVPSPNRRSTMLKQQKYPFAKQVQGAAAGANRQGQTKRLHLTRRADSTQLPPQ